MARLLILTDEQVEAFKKVFEINLQYDDAVVLTTKRAIEGTDVTFKEVEEYVKDYFPDGFPDLGIEWVADRPPGGLLSRTTGCSRRLSNIERRRNNP